MPGTLLNIRAWKCTKTARSPSLVNLFLLCYALPGTSLHGQPLHGIGLCYPMEWHGPLLPGLLSQWWLGTSPPIQSLALLAS